jgi:hypothetical protein
MDVKWEQQGDESEQGDTQPEDNLGHIVRVFLKLFEATLLGAIRRNM